MSETINNLAVIVLLLVIIWLVSSIRQSLLNTPSLTTSAKRIIRRAPESLRTSRQKQPTDQKLAPLDSINPEEAYEAVGKFLDGDRRG